MEIYDGIDLENVNDTNGELKDSAEDEGAGKEKRVADADGKSMKSVKDQKVGLSKSVSFPAKVATANNLKKSAMFAKQRKMDAKNSGRSGSDVAAVIANGGHPAKQTNSAAPPSTRRSLHLKSASVDATANGTSFWARSNNGAKRLLRNSLPQKNEDDANSTTSSTSSHAMSQQKSSGSGFAFRLDERAEKRKEFFMKLEEKTNAKEMEKTNLQARSKENQEAEIRRLRKSLTFKATPMPSFYQEPGPPKVVLKKVAPTRARSPKLGRHKPSSPTAEISSVGKISCRNSPSVLNPNKSNGDGANAADVDQISLKKPTMRMLSKLPSQKSTASKPEAKSAGSKLKSLNSKQKSDEAAAGNGSQHDSLPEAVARMEIDYLKNPTEGCGIDPTVNMNSLESINLADAAILDLSDPEITPNEVLVEG